MYGKKCWTNNQRTLWEKECWHTWSECM